MSGIFGELLTFPQRNGPDVRLRTFGDERYARYEDIDGYTVVYDEAVGRFCYADLAGNRLTSTGVPLDQPPPAHLVRHLQESPAVKRAKIEEARLRRSPPAAARPDGIVRAFAPNRGLLEGRQVSTGSVKGLTILVHFADVASTTTVADVEALLNGVNYNQHGNICSVREFFQRVSDGKLDYSNVVVGPYTLPGTRSSYLNRSLVPEAIQLAVQDGLDLSIFDSRQQRVVDAINIMYAGPSIYQGDLWPHNWTVNLQFGAMRTEYYQITGLGNTPADLSIGTFCHENGHMLCRFPDMYDYGERDGDGQASAGIGYYCLMGSGSHLGNGREPSPVCAYLRELAGWCNHVVDLRTPGRHQVQHGRYGTVLKFPTSKPNEYFLLENRQRVDLDRSAPAGGLAVYHCDTLGSNEYQGGTPDKHYQCALLQADGRVDLEANSNHGDGTDLFGAVSGVVLSSTSRPSTREWDGRESGLVVSDITLVDERTLEFTVGTHAASTTTSIEKQPDLAIPDYRVAGVSSVIEIPVSGIVRRIRVEVDITHPYIGDLQVELMSPTGRRALLHARHGGSNDDLRVSYDSDRPGQLANLVGLPMQGGWVLRVADRARRDVGRFNRWRLEIESTAV